MAQWDSYSQLLNADIATGDELGIWDTSVSQFKNVTVNELGTYIGANYAVTSFGALTGKPTTVSGYGITDALLNTTDTLTGNLTVTGDITGSGTGTFATGVGNGSVGMTINDGQGNANITFNHIDGSTDIAGNAARIVVNTDSTSACTMMFETLSNATLGAVSTTPRMTISDAGLDVVGLITVGGTVDGRDIAADGAKLDTIDSSANNYIFPFSVSAVAGNSTLVQRTALGYINCNYINTTSGVTATAPSHVWVETGTDSYHRKQTPASLISNLDLATNAAVDTAIDTDVQKHWAGSHPTQYYNVVNWVGSTWYITNNHGSPVRVGVADTAYACSGNAATASTASALAVATPNSVTEIGRYLDFNFDGALDYDVRMYTSDAATTGTGTLSVTATNLTCSGNVTAYSDERIKKNIRTIEGALDKVTRLRGVTFDRIDQEGLDNQMGVIAQEVMEVVPEVVSLNEEDDRYHVAYGNMVGLVIEAMKEQQEQIKELREEIVELKARLA